MRVIEASVLLSRHPRHLIKWVRALRLGRKKLRRNRGAVGRCASLDLSDTDIDVLRRALAGELGTLAQVERLSTLASGPAASSRARWHGR